LVVHAGGVLSNFASLSVAGSGSICGGPVSFRGAALAAGATRGEIRAGIIEINHEEFSIGAAPPVFWTEHAAGRLFGVSRESINLIPRPAEMDLQPAPAPLP
jgi:hypothetical protein